MLLRSMRNTKELADAKAENDALRDDVAAGRRLHIKTICQSVRGNTASGVDNAASPDWQTPLNGILSPRQREADLLCKNNWKEPKYVTVQIELPISMGNSYQLLSNTHALPAEYKCLK